MKICSACLLGMRCRFDGQSKAHQHVIRLAEEETLIPVCPEQLGGLPTPRPRTEIVGDRVVNQDGEDVTDIFKKGAEEVLRLAKFYGITTAILKQRSPSCGSGQIYDGTFSGVVQPGDGITARVLKKAGIHVITEDDL